MNEGYEHENGLYDVREPDMPMDAPHSPSAIVVDAISSGAGSWGSWGSLNL